jgi:hypothetical protein
MQRARHNNNRAPRDAVLRDAEGHLVPRLCCHAGPDLKSGERGVEDHLTEMLEHHQKPMNSLVFWAFCEDQPPAWRGACSMQPQQWADCCRCYRPPGYAR